MYRNKTAIIVIVIGTLGCYSCKDEDLSENKTQEFESALVVSSSTEIFLREADQIIAAHQTPFFAHEIRMAEAKLTQEYSSSEFLSNRPDIANLPSGLSPAYLQGDIDEDGLIDLRDLMLLKQLLQGEETIKTYRSVSCAAAADMNLDGSIDADDASLLELFLDDGPTSNGFLYDHTIFPCSHKRSFIAFSQEPICREPLQAQLLPFSPLKGVRLDESSDGTLTQSNQLPGWEFAFDASLLISGSPALVFTHAGNFFIYELSNYCALQPSKELSEKDWGITALPAGEPAGRPPEYGSEIDSLQACPQKNKGCEALVVDFLANSAVWQEPSAVATRDALKKVACNVLYVAPRFVKVPPRPTVRLYTPTSYSSYSKAEQLNKVARRKIASYEALLSSVLTSNRQSWQSINTKIATHRSRLRAGAALAYQLVNAHGSQGSGGTCGKWGVGFDTGTGTLSRAQFHSGNYRAQRKNVCNAVMEDRSCHSGFSANALDWLNNLSLVSCGSPPKENHKRHAAFFGNMVMTSSKAANICSMLDLTILDYSTASYIEQASKDAGYETLAQAFLVRGIGLGQNASGYYSDNGYNRIPSKLCQGASRRY